MPDDPYQLTLRRLTTNDEHFLSEHMSLEATCDPACGLDARTRALVRLAAVITMEGPGPSYGWTVTDALSSGATPEEIVGVLLAIAPVVGVARVVAAAPRLGLAIGYDVDEAFERIDGQ